MAVTAQVAGFLLVFHYQDLPASANFRDFRAHFCALDVRGADGRVFSVVHQQNLVKGNLVPFFVFLARLRGGAPYFFNGNKVTFRDLVLLSACLNNREFHNLDIN